MSINDFDYELSVRKFYTEMRKYLVSNASLRKEYEAEEDWFEFINMDDESRFSLMTEWFIFDYRKTAGSPTILDPFIKRGGFSQEEKALFGAFRDQIFSIFEVKALRLGKQLLLYDLLAEKEYQVFDSLASRSLQKGQCIFVRVMPFESIFILAGRCYPLPLITAPAVRLAILNGSWAFRDHKGATRLNLLDISRILCEAQKPEKLPPEEAFRLFCREAGVVSEEIEQVIHQAKEQSRIKGPSTDILTQFVRKIPAGPKSRKKFMEISDAFMAMWESWHDEARPDARKGPIEFFLIRVCMAHLHQEVDPDDYPDKAAAEKELNRLKKKWLLEPKPEIGWKTPAEMILEERGKTGNPEKEIDFTISLSKIEPGADVEKQAEVLFRQGNVHLKANEPQNAVNAYRKCLEIQPWNPVVWMDLGIAYILMLDVKNALTCYEKALELKPDYDLAKQNLQILKNASMGDLKKMADEFRIVSHNKGKYETFEWE